MVQAPANVTRRRIGIFSTVLALSAASAHAGGMVLPVRGVRTLERAGAFVAGADDADALWLDPAGLAHLAGRGKRALLFDAAFVYHTVEHARIDAEGNLHPPVTNEQPGQPIPTLAGAYAINDRVVIAGGLTSPYGSVHRYAAGGAQRYASVSMEEARFVLITVGVAYKVNDRLRVGGTVQNLVTQLASRVVVSGCPGAMTCAAEDPSFDGVLAIEQDDFISPSGSVGLQYDAHRALTVGLAVQAPQRVSGEGTLAFELPSSIIFDAATVTGDRGRIAFTLPAMVRAGVEWRPRPQLRLEAALGVELWSMHDGVELEPIGVRVEGVGGATIAMQPMTIARDYETSVSPALAIEWHGPKLMLGAGYSYESAAAPPGEVSVLTVDAGKHLVGLGGGYEEAGWQIGAAVGLVAVDRVDVPVADARVTQLAPLADVPSTRAINAGSYESRYVLAGLRFARRW
jgi:long-chain fatty acid transport protein